jgi:flagellar hook assembly protein FlgD
MVKKIVSLLGIVGILSTMVVNTAFAETFTDENLVQGVPSSLGTVDFAGGEGLVENFQVADNADGIAVLLYAESNPLDLLAVFDVEVPVDCDDVTHMCDVSFDWDGVYDNHLAADGNYSLYFYSAYNSGDDFYEDLDEATLTVSEGVSIQTFSVTPATWDPADETLEFDYTLNETADVTVTVYNLDGVSTLKTISKTSSAVSDTMTWGPFNDKDDLLLEGDYSAKMTASAAGETDTSNVVNFTVEYNNVGTPVLSDFTADPASFKADEEETTVSFTLENSAYLTANIVDSNGDVVFTPADFDGADQYSSGSVSFDWDGKKTNGDLVEAGVYTVSLTALNDNGYIVVDALDLTVDSEGSTYYDGAAKIKNIDLDPTATSSSTAWDPIEDELDIEWELTDDFDSLKIEARKGTTEVEIYDEDDLDKDDYDVKFDGLDEDDEYLEPGTWKLLFLGEIDEKTYYVEKEFMVKYDEPKIKEIFVTKDDIDPDQGEGTYLVFKLEDNATVWVELYKDGKSKVDLLEEEELKKNKWYAVYWDGLDDDGDDFDYKDSFKLQLKACSAGDDETCDTASEVVDLDEDDISSSKSNVTQDVVLPPIVGQGDDLTFSFNIEDGADVRVAVWKGTSTSGSADEEILPYTAKKSGDLEVDWNTRDDEGDLVKESEYSYKIFTKKSGSTSTESESGQFVIDNDLGEIFGGPAEESTTTPSYNPSTPLTPVSSNTCGFNDVLKSNDNCDAIEWAKEQGIFAGDPNGNFRPYSSINRAEALKVVLLALGLPVYADNGTNLGWTDTIVGEWYMPYLRSGKEFALLAGDEGKTTVRPESGVSRVELLKFLYEAGKLVGTASVQSCGVNPYTDVFMGVWYTDYACQAKADGLFDVVAGMFMPGEMATRGQVAEALYRFFN